MVEDIRDAVTRLIQAYETEKAENERLRTELEECRRTNEDSRKRISELEKKIDSLKLADAVVTTSAGRKEARARIDRLIQTIDKCISLVEI